MKSAKTRPPGCRASPPGPQIDERKVRKLPLGCPARFRTAARPAFFLEILSYPPGLAKCCASGPPLRRASHLSKNSFQQRGNVSASFLRACSTYYQPDLVKSGRAQKKSADNALRSLRGSNPLKASLVFRLQSLVDRFHQLRRGFGGVAGMSPCHLAIQPHHDRKGNAGDAVFSSRDRI
ncbi:MAG: hypothetical protein JWO94_2216 [Verrucomicrobiaceae bacterium]|nr:hypothetical protein [Verrucomicrobiaceae bacterium]